MRGLLFAGAALFLLLIAGAIVLHEVWPFVQMVLADEPPKRKQKPPAATGETTTSAVGGVGAANQPTPIHAGDGNEPTPVSLPSATSVTSSVASALPTELLLTDLQNAPWRRDEVAEPPYEPLSWTLRPDHAAQTDNWLLHLGEAPCRPSAPEPPMGPPFSSAEHGPTPALPRPDRR